MKKLLTLAVMVTALVLSSCKYDDDDIWNSVHGLEDRVAKLEELCKQMNTNISSLQTIVTALQNNDYVTGVTPVMQSGKEVGYTITFSKSNPITIFHGKDGQNGMDGTDGKDGTTPTIGVKQDVDGIYYWTLDGDWLTDERGDKIKAEGTDGKDGADGENGSDGTDGTNGKDGITPQFKIENDYWFISYDNGDTWTQVGKATGEDGKDGEDGVGGDSMFTGIDYKTSTDYVIFTLADGTQIKLPTWSAFEALQRLCNETNTNLSALQTIVTALQNNDYITSVDPLTENGKVVGYTIKFAKSNPIVIYNGKDGADGVDGNTPVIGVKKDTDGIYYWTLDGEFIVVDGQKIKAQGTDGNNGTDGSDGVTPKLEIREGYWWISYDNGTNWTQLGKATGEDGKDADSIKITQDENNVYFELADGTVITISKTGQTIDPNVIQFEDENVKKLCVAIWDTDGDHELSYDEAAKVTTLGATFKGNTEIQLFNELQHFTGLAALDDTFSGCSNLWRVTIPVNVETISTTTFNGCSQLKRVIFEKGSKLKLIAGSSGNNSKTGGTFSGTALTSIEIPASVESIEACAFRNCTQLTAISFEENSMLKLIGGGYYYSSGGWIRKGAFCGCTSLNTIKIPANVETIEATAFTGCSTLHKVTFETGSQLKIIEGGNNSPNNEYFGAFSNLKALTTFDASACTQIEDIKDSAFWGDSNLTDVRIGTKVPPHYGFASTTTYAFYGISPNAILQVPTGCVDAYKEEFGWNKFSNIIELEK